MGQHNIAIRRGDEPLGVMSATGELVIDSPSTPLPWPNFMQSAGGLFHLSVDQRGMGLYRYAFAENIISKGLNFVVDDGSATPWSAVGGDAPGSAEKYQCVQGPHCSEWRTFSNGIQADVTVTLERDTGRQLVALSLMNETDGMKAVQLTSVNYILLEGRANGIQQEHVERDGVSGALLASRYHAETPKYRFAAYWVCNIPAEQWCGSLIDFRGADVRAGEEVGWSSAPLPNRGSSSEPTIFALRHHIELKPGARENLWFVLGTGETLEECRQEAREIADPEELLRRALEGLNKERVGDDTLLPDSALATQLNTWGRVQLEQQTESARRGPDHNWRNNLQDALGMLGADPSWLKRRIREVALLSESDGFIRRSSSKFPNPDARTAELEKQRHNDIPTWVAFTTARYVKETHDFAFLGETSKHGTILDVVVRGLDWTLNNRGTHGLVLFLDGDWSDPLEAAGREGRGESVWTSMALVHAINELLPILEACGREHDAVRLRNAADEVSTSLNKHAWDGEWYIRGFTDAGIGFCTSTDPDGNVPMLMQAWAVLSQVASPERARIAMETVHSRCITEYGPVLYDPPFLKERTDIGRESAKRPGTAENGSCYTHGAMMLAAAEIKLKDPNRALQIMQSVCPLRDPDDSAVRAGSPLWWPNYYQSPYGSSPGRSSNIISSGAPAWFRLNVIDGLLGLRAELDGLHIEPLLPRGWDDVSTVRQWQGNKYRIHILRSDDYSLELDGSMQPSSVIRPTEVRGKSFEVRVFTP